MLQCNSYATVHKHAVQTWGENRVWMGGFWAGGFSLVDWAPGFIWAPTDLVSFSFSFNQINSF